MAIYALGFQEATATALRLLMFSRRHSPRTLKKWVLEYWAVTGEKVNFNQSQPALTTLYEGSSTLLDIPDPRRTRERVFRRRLTKKGE